MVIRFGLTVSGLALVLSAGPSYAGPCTQQILDVRDAANEKMDALAAAGKAGGESTAATMHRQPTPGSVAKAEAGLGEVSKKDIQAYREAMERAFTEDDANNLAECEKALAEARSIVDQWKPRR
jgi:hypothetical protein